MSMNNFVIRAIFALIIGFVLVMWPDAAADYLVITIGILFIIPGLLGIINYFAYKKRSNVKFRFPVESVGSILFGVWLVVMPAFFADLLMFVLGFILILGGAQQIYSLIIARRWARVSLGFFIVPSLILIAGIVILFNPTNARHTAFMIIGITCIIYALSELINWFKFMNRRPKLPVKTDVVDVEILDE